MFHTAVYHESINTAGALTRITPVLDQVLTQQNDAYIVPTWAKKLAMVYPMGQLLVGAQMQSPKMRETSELDIPQFDDTPTPTDFPSFLNMTDSPRELDSGEGLEAHVAEVNGIATDETVVVWLVNDFEPVPEGPKEIILANAIFTSVAFQWTLAPLVLTQQLRAGIYAITNLKVYSSTGIAARLQLEQQVPRPGVIVQPNQTLQNNRDFDCPRLGKWGEFVSTFLPQLEILTQGIDTSATVYLEVVKIGELPTN